MNPIILFPILATIALHTRRISDAQRGIVVVRNKKLALIRSIAWRILVAGLVICLFVYDNPLVILNLIFGAFIIPFLAALILVTPVSIFLWFTMSKSKTNAIFEKISSYSFLAYSIYCFIVPILNFLEIA